ncbi:MsnO8 family LLM class oxidoreductase [Streptomyces flavofungini]|uniref:MsnO8 family LLM class oxidoreductase n=1 Tax=Streptomyces flavofungini TaxID=68200 RepID=A0ABS0XJ66_9ACTN|nr:MsnO8 family LLM class oxidoreductase [Streptomyces flavofungini]MBJ3811127.1 MsnO8 family LLM class oxidoreductase [Streptomyces flavofungini]MBJ3813255.1 MsnO8 family LLM class oxidoreductase [Streptomyces flavofungini]GHC67829.1 FMN-linked alkanal monooxygenase [Streptomyces flavofungini]
MINLPLSALEVSIVEAGTTPADALANCQRTAQELSRLGYDRLWFAEHHQSPAIGAFPPVLLAAHIAATTPGLRLGSGGVLAPNHAPITIAEQFATLATLHPDRIDLGIGRGPGTFHEPTARALRRGADPTTDDEYRRDVTATLDHLLDVGIGELPEPWLLASSDAGAELAAALGLPIAFAHHIRPDNTLAALKRYRDAFRPSRWSAAPRVLVCVETVCADTEERAAELARPMDIIKAGLLKGQGEQPFPTLAAAAAHQFTAQEEQALGAFVGEQARGTRDTVEAALTRIAESTGADELMIVTPVHSTPDRLRSFALVRDIVRPRGSGHSAS